MDIEMERGIESHPKMPMATSSPLLKDKANKFSETVCMVGLRHATDARSSKGRRLVWLMWMLVGIGLAFYQIQNCLAYYSKSPYTTEFEMVNPTELRLPQVTLCNEYMMMKSKAEELGIYEYVKSFTLLQKVLSGEETIDVADTADMSAVLFENVEKLGEATKDWESVSEQLAQSMDDAIISFKWSGDIQGRASVIQSKTDMGHCFAISSVNHPLISTSAGMKYGLRLELDAQPLEYFPSMQYDTEMSGFRILIHDPLEIPRMRDSGFTASPGNVVRVAISLENISYPGPPHSNCINDPDYRMSNCIANCDDAFYAKKCGCRPYYAQGDTRVCKFLEQDECDSEIGNERKEDPTGAACNCPQQCNRRIYKHFISQSKLTQKSLFAWNTTDATDATKIVLHVYFQHLTYMQINSVPAYSLSILLSDVGGALSLLLGATLLTVYEVAEFIVEVAIDYINHRVKNYHTSRSAASAI